MEKQNQDVQTPESIAYFAHQGIVNTLERYHVRVVVVLCVIILILLAWAGVETVLRHKENKTWLDYIAEYDFTDYVYTQDGRGLNIIGDSNGVDYNVPTSDYTDENEEEPQLGAGESNPQA